MKDMLDGSSPRQWDKKTIHTFANDAMLTAQNDVLGCGEDK